MDSTVVMIPRKKSRKDCPVINEDRISSLPDDIIRQILSYLPTADAVATCVLSKYWMYKWTSIYRIDIDDKKRYHIGASGEAMFIKFMKRTLIYKQQDIRSISFKLLYQYKPSVVKPWISTLLSRKMEILYIDIHQYIIIRGNSLNSTSLRELVMKNLSLSFKVPESNLFGLLRNLCLENVIIRNDIVDTDTLHFTFPVLQVLKLLKCTWFRVTLVEISAPELNTFISETSLSDGFDHYKIKILGASLSNFTAKGGEAENFVLSGSKIVHAALQNIIYLTSAPLISNGLRMRSLLNGFSPTLEELTVSLYVAEAILQSRHECCNIRFGKLERLVFCSTEHVIPGGTEAVFELLRTTPCLKFMAIDVLCWSDYDYDALEFIPSCIVSSLEEIMFVNITGSQNVLRLAKFLLKHAANLKKFHVDPVCSVKVETVKDVISAYPTASTSVTIVPH